MNNIIDIYCEAFFPYKSAGVKIFATLQSGKKVVVPIVWAPHDFEINTPEQSCKLVQSLFTNGLLTLMSVIKDTSDE